MTHQLNALLRILKIALNPLSAPSFYFRKTFGRRIDWKNPKNLIEKIYWLEMYSDISLWAKCADKYSVRDYVKSAGYDKMLVKLLGKYKNVEQIDWDNLPKQFVIKTTHGSGDAIIVKDKNKINIKEIESKVNNVLNTSYGFFDGQWHYTKIQPQIIIEEMLQIDNRQKEISPNSLIDYKIWCFNGVPEYILICYDRKKEGLKLLLYDVKWNKLLQYMKPMDHYIIDSSDDIIKPVCLPSMLEMAATLSRPFPECRVDLYVVNDMPFFGELTFSTGYGYFTDEFYDLMGKKTDISNIPKNPIINVRPLAMRILKEKIYRLLN